MKGSFVNKVSTGVLVIMIVFGFPGTPLMSIRAHAASSSFNKEINYQGKLANSAGVTVSDGDYNIRFKLYSASTGGSALWEESYTSATSQITVTSGLFSVLLGQITSLSSFDFNRDLYLSIEVGGTTTPAVWDGEMTPRKQLGTVPSAFEADKLDGLDSDAFIRSDIVGTSTGGLLVLASSTLQNFTASLATTSAATTTALYVSGATTTRIANGVNILAGCYAINGTCLNIGSGLTGSGAANRAAFWTAVGNLSYDDTFVWDNTNKRLGIGTTSPYAKLSVTGEVVGQMFTATSTTATSTFMGGVGIGTSSPGYKLSVEDGNIYANNGSLLIGGTGDGGLLARINVDSGSSIGHTLINLKSDTGTMFTVDGRTSIGLARFGSGGATPGPSIVNIKTMAATDVGLVIRPFTGQSADMFQIRDISDNIVDVIDPSGFLGIGTSSPYAKSSIHSNNGETNTILFAIGSSTVSATTTLFSISNTGSTTAANGFDITAGCYAINGACVGGSSLTGSGVASRAAFWTAAGNLSYDDAFVWDNTTKTLGIGTTSPYATLSVVGTSGVVAERYFATSSTATSTFMGQVLIGTTSASVSNWRLTVAGGVCIMGASSCPATQAAGGLAIDTSGGTPITGSIFDIAELYPASEIVAPGEIMAIDIQSSERAEVNRAREGDVLVGIVSTSPALTINGSFVKIGPPELISTTTRPLVALVGRVPVKVNLENGQIKKGDAISASSEPGVGKKASVGEQTVGIALEDWNNEPEKNDRVLVFVNLSAPRLSDAIIGDEIDVSLETMWSLSSGGDIIAGSNINLNGRALRSVASIASASGNWSIDESGVLRVKEVHAEKLCLGETCVTEGELRTIMQTAGLIAPASVSDVDSAQTTDTVISDISATELSTPDSDVLVPEEPALEQVSEPVPEPSVAPPEEPPVI